MMGCTSHIPVRVGVPRADRCGKYYKVLITVVRLSWPREKD